MSDKLATMSVTEFVDLLASVAPAPGGGSVAALAGVQAAALAAMVCRLTIGRKKYAAVEAQIIAALPKLEEARRELLNLVDADTEAYRMLAAAMGLPKESNEQKAARQRAMRTASKTAAKVPATTMVIALSAARLIHQLHPIANQNCLSDMGTAMQTAQTAVLGAAMNVLINLPGTGDEVFSQEARREVDAAVREVQMLATETCSAIFRALGRE